MGKDITNEQLFEFMTKMYSEMQEGFKGLENRINGLDNKVVGLENEVKVLKDEVKEIKNKVILIEQEHGRKLDALFDGYMQNSEKLNRIEEEVSKHEETILRRV